jgi:hypothetical protein
MMKILLLVLLCSCLHQPKNGGLEFNLSGAPNIQISPSNGEVTFVSLKEKIFEPRCVKCHKWILDEIEVQSRLKPGSPETSDLFLQVESGDMPPKGDDLTTEQLEMLRQYINSLPELTVTSQEI